MHLDLQEQVTIQQMGHSENGSFQLESAVDYSHYLQPVAISDLFRVKLHEQREDVQVLSNLFFQVPRGLPFLLLHRQDAIGLPECLNLACEKSECHTFIANAYSVNLHLPRLEPSLNQPRSIILAET